MMKEDKFNKITLTALYALLTIFIGINFYFTGYLRDYSIYDLDFLMKINLIIFPSLIILFMYLKRGSHKLKLVLYLIFVFLFVLNVYLNLEIKESISKYESGSISSADLMNLDDNYVGKIYFYRDDCPSCKDLTKKIRKYNKGTDMKILMYNTNDDLLTKEEIIKKYGVIYVPMIISIDEDGHVNDVTESFLDE